jgi:hypothetical protein
MKFPTKQIYINGILWMERVWNVERKKVERSTYMHFGVGCQKRIKNTCKNISNKKIHGKQDRT